MKSTAGPVYDVIVIGGGPAGSTVASYLTKEGRSVLVLEKESFPRFHIGESLLPYNREIFQELGVLSQLEDSSRFVQKKGAQLGLWDGSNLVKIVFGKGSFTEMDSAFQVERSVFDQLLLDRAKELGAEVREGCAVRNYEILPQCVQVRTEDDSEYQGKFLVDASGTTNFTGNRERIKQVHPHLKKIAVFTHYQGVEDLPGCEAGDIQIFRHPRAWFWLIPLGNQKVSVGVVFDKKLLSESDQSPKEWYHQFVKESSALSDRLKDATMTMKLRTMVDFSYSNQRLASDRLIRVGDAAGFIDPIFSSGVYLAMKMARAAASALGTTLDQSTDDGHAPQLSQAMRRYEKEARRQMHVFRRLIEGFYKPAFFEVLLHPRKILRLPCALNAVFAGRLDEIWAIRWRLEFFFFLTNYKASSAFCPVTVWAKKSNELTDLHIFHQKKKWYLMIRYPAVTQICQ